MENDDNIVIEDAKIIDEQVIEEKVVEETKESFFDKAKKQKDIKVENYKKYSESEDFSEKTDMLRNLVSWDTIKILIYIFIMTFIINDIQNFLLSVIIALLLIKLDVLEPLFRFIRSLLKK